MNPPKSITLYRFPRIFAMPRYHDLVSGTVATVGTAITSPASASRINHWLPPHDSPRRDCSTWAVVFAARRVASSCWNARRLSLAARAIRKSAERRYLREQLVAIDRLDDVVARALPHTPDLVGFLALGRAKNDRNGPRDRIAADGSGR